MIRKHNRTVIVSVIAIGLMLCGVLYARNRSENLTFSRADIRILNVDVNFLAGRFDIMPLESGGPNAAVLNGSYDEDYFNFRQDYETRDNRGNLYFETENIRNETDDVDNEWELAISPDVETRLNLDIGASDSRFDLGGLMISELDLDVGAAEARITFNEKNKTRMRYLSIDAGACDLEIFDLGNANFEFLDFDGGVGDFVLDFGGNIDYEAEVKIDVGLGSIDIILPEDLAVRLEGTADGWFSSIDFPRRHLVRSARYNDVYETEGFDEAEGRLTLIIDVGMGEADINFR